jgi:NADH:ubiquinone oxidoreductase subunit 5 (subunit L)/multisubunit Na+/H+ antiporter MnhA subunit
MWFLVFDGTSRSAHLEHASHSAPHDDHGHGHGDHHGDPVAHAHESEPAMAWPLIALAIPSVIVGYPITILPIGEPILEQMLSPLLIMRPAPVLVDQQFVGLLRVAKPRRGIGIRVAIRVKERRLFSKGQLDIGRTGTRRNTEDVVGISA